MSTVLTVNPGSHSLQLHLVDTERVDVLDSTTVVAAPDSHAATKALDEFLDGSADPDLVAYRLVHGGDHITEPSLVDDRTGGVLDELAELAPLHVPMTAQLLRTLRPKLPDRPHILCPDTAFHRSLPPEVTTLALPSAWRQRWGLRRYGFHGLSYGWALRRTADLLGKPADELNLVVAHLGGGCSVCAIRAGHSVDTSMSFTPLDGIPMSTRSGAIDPGLVIWLLQHGGLDADEVADGLEHHAGLLGLSGDRSADTRDLVKAAADGHDGAKLALSVFAFRVAREMTAMTVGFAADDALDAIVFTGEIGWDQPEVRRDICARLNGLGVDLPILTDTDADGPVTHSGTPVLVVEPREELQLALTSVTAGS